MTGDGFGHIATSMADSAVPEAGHAIDVLIALIVVDHGTLTAYEGAKVGSSWLGKGMQKC